MKDHSINTVMSAAILTRTNLMIGPTMGHLLLRCTRKLLTVKPGDLNERRPKARQKSGQCVCKSVPSRQGVLASEWTRTNEASRLTHDTTGPRSCEQTMAMVTVSIDGVLFTQGAGPLWNTHQAYTWLKWIRVRMSRQ